MRFIREFILTFFLCLIYTYAHYTNFFTAHQDKILLPLIWAVYYSFVCYFVFFISIHVAKSEKIFFLGSLGTIILLLVWDMHGAKAINLSQKIVGQDIYISGNITLCGFIYKLLDPAGFMGLWALYKILRKHFLSHRGEGTA